MATLRAARADDAAGIARLAGALGYPVDAGTVKARLEALLPQAGQHVVVAAGEGALLGWVAAERRLTLESGERVEIVGLVVDAAARRSGVGRALVAEAERWAQAQGFAEIVVRSNVVRAESHPFYRGLGYLCRKTQHVYAKPLAVDG